MPTQQFDSPDYSEASSEFLIAMMNLLNALRETVDSERRIIRELTKDGGEELSEDGKTSAIASMKVFLLRADELRQCIARSQDKEKRLKHLEGLLKLGDNWGKSLL